MLNPEFGVTVTPAAHPLGPGEANVRMSNRSQLVIAENLRPKCKPLYIQRKCQVF